MTKEDLDKKLKELEASLEETKSKLAKAEERATAATSETEAAKAEAELAKSRYETLSKLTAEERECFDSWDAKGQETFLKANEEQREDLLAKAKDVSSQMPAAIQKQFDELRKQNAEITKQNEALKSDVSKAEEARRLTELVSKAETDYPNLPGEPQDKGKILKSLEKLEEEEREAVHTLLKAGNEALGKLTSSTGSDVSPTGGDAWSQIEKKAKVIAKERAITVQQGIDAVMKEDVELYNRYLQENPRQTS